MRNPPQSDNRNVSVSRFQLRQKPFRHVRGFRQTLCVSSTSRALLPHTLSSSFKNSVSGRSPLCTLLLITSPNRQYSTSRRKQQFPSLQKQKGPAPSRQPFLSVKCADRLERKPCSKLGRERPRNTLLVGLMNPTGLPNVVLVVVTILSKLLP